MNKKLELDMEKAGYSLLSRDNLPPLGSRVSLRFTISQDWFTLKRELFNVRVVGDSKQDLFFLP